MATFKQQIEALAGSTTNTQAEQWIADGIKDVISRFSVLRPELLHLFSSEQSAGTGTYINGNAGTHAVSSGDTVDIINTARELITINKLALVKDKSTSPIFISGPILYTLNWYIGFDAIFVL